MKGKLLRSSSPSGRMTRSKSVDKVRHRRQDSGEVTIESREERATTPSGNRHRIRIHIKRCKDSSPNNSSLRQLAEEAAQGAKQRRTRSRSFTHCGEKPFSSEQLVQMLEERRNRKAKQQQQQQKQQKQRQQSAADPKKDETLNCSFSSLNTSSRSLLGMLARENSTSKSLKSVASHRSTRSQSSFRSLFSSGGSHWSGITQDESVNNRTQSVTTPGEDEDVDDFNSISVELKREGMENDDDDVYSPDTDFYPPQFIIIPQSNSWKAEI